MGGPSGIKHSEAPYININSSPLCVFKFLLEVIELLVMETNILQSGPGHTSQSTFTTSLTGLEPEVFLFLAVILQMGYDI
jgi:hypothetical protein